ncbi:MAG: hypothetical protein IJ054_06810 [Lachnospiraceae bacterium]|nr:hypothetical protein [Lachnospiraceae bacterium]
MVFVVILLLVLVVGVIIVLKNFLNKVGYKASQSVLKKVGLDNQSLGDKIVNGPLHKKGLAQLMNEHPGVTPEQVENIFQSVCSAVLSGTQLQGLDSAVVQKVRSGNKFAHIQSGVYTKTGIVNYKNGAVYAQSVFMEGNDQWILYIRGNFDALMNLTVTQLQISKGMQGGF